MEGLDLKHYIQITLNNNLTNIVKLRSLTPSLTSELLVSKTSNLNKKTEANWTCQRKDLRFLALATSFKLVQKNTEPAALELSKKQNRKKNKKTKKQQKKKQA